MTPKPLEIRFSSHYRKLRDDVEVATLLEVFKVERSQLSSHFIDYDTQYKGADKKGSHYYKLPNTTLLVLLFEGQRPIKENVWYKDLGYEPFIFTTVRTKIGRYGRDKEAYYRSKIGELFKVVYTEEPNVEIIIGDKGTGMSQEQAVVSLDKFVDKFKQNGHTVAASIAIQDLTTKPRPHGGDIFIVDPQKERSHLPNETKVKRQCPHKSTTVGSGWLYFYRNSINEDGWECQCGQKLGYRPDLDKEHLYMKVSGLLLDLHDNRFVYISNGSEGEGITDHVYQKCRNARRYDQAYILKSIIEAVGWRSHSDYWRKQAKSWQPPEQEKIA